MDILKSIMPGIPFAPPASPQNAAAGEPAADTKTADEAQESRNDAPPAAKDAYGNDAQPAQERSSTLRLNPLNPAYAQKNALQAIRVNANNARLGIIMSEILGPCRARRGFGKK